MQVFPRKTLGQGRGGRRVGVRPGKGVGRAQRVRDRLLQFTPSLKEKKEGGETPNDSG